METLKYKIIKNKTQYKEYCFTLEDLISAKKILGREKDIAMIKELRVIQAGLKKKK